MQKRLAMHIVAIMPFLLTVCFCMTLHNCVVLK